MERGDVAAVPAESHLERDSRRSDAMSAIRTEPGES